MGHLNMHNVHEAGAELAIHLNRVMSYYHYKPGETSGIIIQGKIQNDKYKERMAKLGIIVMDDGTVLQRDTNIEQYRADNRPAETKEPSQPPPFQPKITPTQKLTRHMSVSQKNLPNAPKTLTPANPQGFIMALQEFTYIYKCIPNLKGHKLLVNQNSRLYPGYFKAITLFFQALST